LKAVERRNYINLIEEDDKILFEILGSKVQIKVFKKLKRRDHVLEKEKNMNPIGLENMISCRQTNSRLR
jgi:hypothetical protein